MWLNQSALDRIHELEAQLRDSVPREVYATSLARIAELERRNDWAMDMLLRRGGSLPVPAAQPAGESPSQTEPPAVSDTQMAQAEAIAVDAQRLGLGRQETVDALKRSVPGITEEAIAEAISRGRVM